MLGKSNSSKHACQGKATLPWQDSSTREGDSPLKWSSRVSYFLAGACFTNAVPHLIIAATGSESPLERDQFCEWLPARPLCRQAHRRRQGKRQNVVGPL